MQVICPYCRQAYDVDSEYVGETATCGVCDKDFVMVDEKERIKKAYASFKKGLSENIQFLLWDKIIVRDLSPDEKNKIITYAREQGEFDLITICRKLFPRLFNHDLGQFPENIDEELRNIFKNIPKASREEDYITPLQIQELAKFKLKRCPAVVHLRQKQASMLISRLEELQRLRTAKNNSEYDDYDDEDDEETISLKDELKEQLLDLEAEHVIAEIPPKDVRNELLEYAIEHEEYNFDYQSIIESAFKELLNPVYLKLRKLVYRKQGEKIQQIFDALPHANVGEEGITKAQKDYIADLGCRFPVDGLGRRQASIMIDQLKELREELNTELLERLEEQGDSED